MFVWEASRFYHLFDLCERRGEARKIISMHVSSWIDQNPWMIGVHWDNALEASLRAISWVYADGRLAQQGDDEWVKIRKKVLSAIWWHGRFIEKHLSVGGYNHLIGDAAGLTVIGASYPDMADADRWRNRGVEILMGEIDRQILKDGTHVEQAPAYARFVADLYLLAGHVLGGTASLEGQKCWAAAEKLLEALMWQVTPTGNLPGYGDDGVTVFWTCPPDLRVAISLGIAASITRRRDFKHVCLLSGGVDRVRQIIGRVFGTDRLCVFDNIVPSAPVKKSVCLSKAGVAIHRTGWTQNSKWVLFKCGPMGTGGCAHGHADILQVLWHNKYWPALKDPGTPTYNGDDALRWESTSTEQHNTVCVDGQSQATLTGRFNWESLVAGQELRVRESGDSWIAEGTVSYEVMGQHVKHRRKVENMLEFVIIEDEVQCHGEHSVLASLLFDGLLRWNSETGELLTENGRGVRIEFSGWKEASVKMAYISPVYSKKVPATRLVLTAPMYNCFCGSISFAGVRAKEG